MTAERREAVFPAMRAATLADAERISHLLNLLRDTYLVSPTSAETEAFLRSINESSIRVLLARGDLDYVVAEGPAAEVLAGAAGMKRDGQLLHLFVHPAFQGKGLGRRLWECLRDRAVQAGYSGAFTVYSSVNAVPVYERFGFTISGSRVEKGGGVSVPMTYARPRVEAPLPPTPTLQISRLVLRPIRLADVPAVQRQFPRWEIVQWLNGDLTPWPYPADGAETNVRACLEERARGERFFWAICLEERPEELRGRIGLWADDGTCDQRGFWIASELQGRGLMTEAAECVTEYAFVGLGWPSLWLTNAQGNISSRRIKEKQGATLVKRRPRRWVCGDGIEEVWLLERDRWIARRTA